MSDGIAPAQAGQGTAAPAAAPAPSTQTAALLQPAAAPPVPTTAQINAAPAQPATAAVPWLGEADEVTLGYVANKGWTEPKQVLDSYRNLEKFVGADKANNALILPKDGADAKEWNAVYDRLGRPTGPDGYKVELPEGGDKDLQGKVFNKMHELGLTKTQGEELTKWFNETSVGMVQANQAQRAANFAQEDAAVRAEWGHAYAQNLAAAQQAARGLGLDAASLDKISDGIGHKATMNLLSKIGGRLGEAEFVSNGKPAAFSAALSPGQAKAQIETLKQDKDFVSRYAKGGLAEKAEMARLHGFAHPEG